MTEQLHLPDTFLYTAVRAEIDFQTLYTQSQEQE